MRSLRVDGEAVKRARESAGLTQEFVAVRLGVTRSAVALWETGRTQPNAGNFMALCCELQVRPDSLLAVDGHEVA